MQLYLLLCSTSSEIYRWTPRSFGLLSKHGKRNQKKIIQDIFHLWLSTDMDHGNCYSICPSPKPLCASAPGKAEGSSRLTAVEMSALGPPLKSDSNYLSGINRIVPTTDSPFQEQQTTHQPVGLFCVAQRKCKWGVIAGKPYRLQVLPQETLQQVQTWQLMEQEGRQLRSTGNWSCLTSISSPTVLSKKLFLLKHIH